MLFGKQRDRPTRRHSASSSIDHANRCFEYIRYLNLIENDRPQSIIVVNGLLIALLGVLADDFKALSLVQRVLLLFAFSFSGASLLFSLRIFWPKTDDSSSPIHHTGVREHSRWQDFSTSIKQSGHSQMIDDICRESWVVAGIVAWRGQQVKRSAFLFCISLLLTLCLIIAKTL